MRTEGIEEDTTTLKEEVSSRAYYWTKNEEEPAVYHDNENCSEGKKIESKNREDGSTPPAGRRLCDVCEELH